MGEDFILRDTFCNITVLLILFSFDVQKPEVVDSNRKHRKRVLVCAPSNSALDEIVLRLLTTGMCFCFHYLKVGVGLMCYGFRFS